MIEERSDSILIELRVIAVQMAPKIWMQGDLAVIINGEKPCSESDIVDVEALQESMEREGDYFIFTCNCGIPECSGWYKPIEVRHQGDLIVWTDPNANKTWRLERGRMEEDLEAAAEEVQDYQQYFKEKDIDYVGFGCS